MKKGYTFDFGDILVSYFSCKDELDNLARENCHDRYEIVCSLSPLGHCTVEGQEYALDPRSLLLIPPLAYHAHKYSDEIEFEGYTIRFSRDVLSENVLPMLVNIISVDETNGIFYSPSRVSDALCDIFRRFDDAIILPEIERRAFVETLICEVIIFLSAAGGKVVSHSENELGAKVAKYLNSNIEKNISLDKLASRFFVSKYHLCRAFKKYSGTSVHSYINQKRIMYAKQLIESGETASGAADRVGFGDYSAFYRAYVRIVGRSPTKE